MKTLKLAFPAYCTLGLLILVLGFPADAVARNKKDRGDQASRPAVPRTVQQVRQHANERAQQMREQVAQRRQQVQETQRATLERRQADRQRHQVQRPAPQRRAEPTRPAAATPRIVTPTVRHHVAAPLPAIVVSKPSAQVVVKYQTCSWCGVRYHGSHTCARTKVVYQTCSRCGVRYHGSHTCARTAVVYQTCSSCGVRYTGSHTCARTTIVYQTCGRCGVRYHGHHDCPRKTVIIYKTCGSCGARYHGHHDCPRRTGFSISIGIGWHRCDSCHVWYHGHHDCHSTTVVYHTCSRCGVRYHGHHDCSHHHVRYVRCGHCHVYHASHVHHVCVVRPAVVYVTCNDCGVRYISTTTHVCLYGTVSYTRCDHCDYSYRTGTSHTCRTSYETSTGPYTAPYDGWTLLRRDTFDLAIRRFETDLGNDADNGTYHAGIAIAYAMQGRDEEAMKTMRKAIDLQPDALKAVPTDERIKSITSHLASVYRGQTESGTSQELADAWFMVAAMEAAQKKYAEASAAIKQAVDLGDTQATTLTLQNFIEAESNSR